METEHKRRSTFMDRTGQRYGKLTVLKFIGDKKWLCRCDCGNEIIVRSCNLSNGHTNSCGCLRQWRLQDLTGQRFGKLLVLEYVGHMKWKCRCDCGNEVIKDGKHLRWGNTRSCGCLKPGRRANKTDKKQHLCTSINKNK